MYQFIVDKVGKQVSIGIVGGSDMSKILEQMGGKQGEFYIHVKNIVLTLKYM